MSPVFSYKEIYIFVNGKYITALQSTKMYRFLRKVFIDGNSIMILLHFIHKFSIFFFTTVL